jgi:hypothetical protein
LEDVDDCDLKKNVLEDVDNCNLKKNHFQLEGDDMHHDSIMEGFYFNMYRHSYGLMMRSWTEQL